MTISSFLVNKNIPNRLDGISSSERELVKGFRGYLTSVEGTRILSISDRGYYDMPYTTRWSDSYKKKMIGKMYAVEEYCKHSGKGVITLLTLTGYQDGNSSINTLRKTNTREELFGDSQEKSGLKGGWRLLSNLIAKTCPDLENLWVIEPHKSGYPHMHVAVLGYIPKEMQERLARLWSEKYHVGSKEHGINFSVKSIKESVQSIRNYLMKYISKGIGAGGNHTWTAAEWVYHAIAWKHQHRYIGMSRSISRYCTAYRLRFKFQRYMRYIQDLMMGDYDHKLPELPVDKAGLLKAIQRFRWRAPHDNPPPKEERWFCTFIKSNGILTPIRKSPYFDMIVSPETVRLINAWLSQAVGYSDQFLKVSKTQWNLGLGLSNSTGQTTII